MFNILEFILTVAIIKRFKYKQETNFKNAGFLSF
jgi:hypothetical protein